MTMLVMNLEKLLQPLCVLFAIGLEILGGMKRALGVFISSESKHPVAA